ncbi:MAG: 50S ribosomal protein L13 [Endomicrobiia bacterium]
MAEQRNWYLVDLKDKILGRISTKIATILQGKHKPNYCRNVDTGDFVVAINASKIKVTRKKAEQKIYFTHSGYPGGDKYIPYKKLFEKNPQKVIWYAVRGMLPKNKLRDKILKRLKIYSDDLHPFGNKNLIKLEG